MSFVCWLVNMDGCTFDSCEFSYEHTFEDMMRWGKGRGGNYTINIEERTDKPRGYYCYAVVRNGRVMKKETMSGYRNLR